MFINAESLWFVIPLFIVSFLTFILVQTEHDGETVTFKSFIVGMPSLVGMVVSMLLIPHSLAEIGGLWGSLLAVIMFILIGLAGNDKICIYGYEQTFRIALAVALTFGIGVSVVYIAKGISPNDVVCAVFGTLYLIELVVVTIQLIKAKK